MPSMQQSSQFLMWFNISFSLSPWRLKAAAEDRGQALKLLFSHIDPYPVASSGVWDGEGKKEQAVPPGGGGGGVLCVRTDNFFDCHVST